MIHHKDWRGRNDDEGKETKAKQEGMEIVVSKVQHVDRSGDSRLIRFPQTGIIKTSNFEKITSRLRTNSFLSSTQRMR